MNKRHGRRLSMAAVWLSVAALSWLPACGADSAAGPAPGPTASQPVTAPASLPEPAPAPAPAEGASAETRPAVDPAAMKVLVALEQGGATYQTIRADLEMTVLLPALGDREHRSGWVAYRRGFQGESEKIRVHFETLKLGDGPNTRQREDYTFDGQWATEAKHSVKQLTRWQLAEQGERVQALRIGKGAFPPLPFGQKAQEVLEYYDASLVPPAEGDPPGCDHLELAALRTRRGELDFLHLDLWISRKTHLPAKVAGTDKDKNTKTVVLTNMQTDIRLPGDTF
ncbi:MAG: hypothetical protein MUP47_04505, partial [Phycisphaerae bacterium]|nr:hypothetical protein [Phycisphaerae bacterium]